MLSLASVAFTFFFLYLSASFASFLMLSSIFQFFGGEGSGTRSPPPLKISLKSADTSKTYKTKYKKYMTNQRSQISMLSLASVTFTVLFLYLSCIFLHICFMFLTMFEFLGVE